MATWGPLVLLLDAACLTVFVAEIGLELYALGGRFFRSAWNVFDLMVVIPMLIDQNLCAQARRPMEVILSGWASSLFQASQQWATMSS